MSWRSPRLVRRPAALASAASLGGHPVARRLPLAPALLFVLGTTPATKELTKFGRDVLAARANATPLIVVGAVYLLITIPLTQLVAVLERRNARAR